LSLRFVLKTKEEKNTKEKDRVKSYTKQLRKIKSVWIYIFAEKYEIGLIK